MPGPALATSPPSHIGAFSPRRAIDARPIAGDGSHRPHDSVAATRDYRARARRLRHTFASDPVQKHRALSELAKGQPRTSDANAVPVHVIARPAIDRAISAAERFARIVGEQVDGPLLPFARRQAVLRAAARLGVSRFDANLRIAAELHRYADARAGDEVVERDHAPMPAWAIAGGIVLAEAFVAVTVCWGVWGR